MNDIIQSSLTTISVGGVKPSLVPSHHSPKCAQASILYQILYIRQGHATEFLNPTSAADYVGRHVCLRHMECPWSPYRGTCTSLQVETLLRLRAKSLDNQIQARLRYRSLVSVWPQDTAPIYSWHTSKSHCILTVVIWFLWSGSLADRILIYMHNNSDFYHHSYGSKHDETPKGSETCDMDSNNRQYRYR